MTILKFIYTLILKPIFILSIFLLGVLSALLIYITVSSKVDFGSFPDWISAAGSVGTLYIAWRALQAAPNWFKQKLDESAIPLAVEMIENIAPEINKRMEDVLMRHGDIKSNLNYYTESGSYYRNFELKEKIDEMVQIIRSLEKLYLSMERIEESLNKRGWTLNPAYSYNQSGVRDVLRIVNHNTVSGIENYEFLKSKIDYDKQYKPEDLQNDIDEIERTYKKLHGELITLYVFTSRLTSVRLLENIFV